MPSRLAHLLRWRAFLRTRLPSMSIAVTRWSYPCDAALALDLVLERDRAAAERRQLDGPRHQSAVVDRPRRDLRDVLAAGRVILGEQVRVGGRHLDIDLLDLGDRDPLGDHDCARRRAEVRQPDRDADGLDVPAAEQARVI